MRASSSASASVYSPHSRNYQGNGYKSSAQWFLGLFQWIVFKLTLNLSYTIGWGSTWKPSTNHNQRFSTQTNPEITASKACTHSLWSYWTGKLPSFSMSQNALKGSPPSPPESNQYRPLGARPSEASLISLHDEAGSKDVEPRNAVKRHELLIL